MLAVQCSFKDQSSILNKLEEIKVRLSEQQNLSEEDVIEWQQLCDWMKKDNFSFFGYCSFNRKSSVSDQAFELQKSSGLGILSDTYLDQDGNQMSEVLKAGLSRKNKNTHQLGERGLRRKKRNHIFMPSLLHACGCH